MLWIQIGDVKNFLSNHNISLNMKKKKEEAFWYNELYNSKWWIVFGL